MAKAKKNRTRNVIIISAIVVLAAAAVYFSVFQTAFFTSGNTLKIRTYESTKLLEPEVGEFNFAGYNGEYETTFLGSALSDGRPGGYYINGQDDGEIFIENSFSDGKRLTIDSKLEINSYTNGASNNNYFTVELPAGTINIRCETEVYSRAFNGAVASCGVLDKEIVKTYSSNKIADKNYINSEFKEIEIILEESENITFIALTNFRGMRNAADSYVTLVASFDADPVAQEDPADQLDGDQIAINETGADCQANVDCVTICGPNYIPTCTQEGACICEFVEEDNFYKDNSDIIWMVAWIGFAIIVAIIIFVMVRRWGKGRKKKR